MFTGIVEEVGAVRRVTTITGGVEMWVTCRLILDDLRVSDSVAIDGVCQTVTRRDTEGFCVQAVGETLEKTTLGSFRPGRSVNLERSLRPDSRMGGHFVQGHVQGVGTVAELVPRGAGYLLVIAPPMDLMRYIAREGSIAIDGVSLTVAEVRDDRFSINLIPYSADATTLARFSPGDRVNIEVDIIGRYVERFLSGWVAGNAESAPPPGPGLSLQQMKEWGYR